MKTKIFSLLAIIGLILGLASPLPIWPGSLFYMQTTPGIISAILILIACLGSIKKGSKIVGIISLVYGVLATLLGLAILLLGLVSNRSQTITTLIVLYVAILVVIVGITSIILGFKTYRARKT